MDVRNPGRMTALNTSKSHSGTASCAVELDWLARPKKLWIAPTLLRCQNQCMLDFAKLDVCDDTLIPWN